MNSGVFFLFGLRQFTIYQRSVNPIPTGGGQIIPTYYYWHPQCFSSSGINVCGLVIEISRKIFCLKILLYFDTISIILEVEKSNYEIFPITRQDAWHFMYLK